MARPRAADTYHWSTNFTPRVIGRAQRASHATRRAGKREPLGGRAYFLVRNATQRGSTATQTGSYPTRGVGDREQAGGSAYQPASVRNQASEDSAQVRRNEEHAAWQAEHSWHDRTPTGLARGTFHARPHTFPARTWPADSRDSTVVPALAHPGCVARREIAPPGARRRGS